MEIAIITSAIILLISIVTMILSGAYVAEIFLEEVEYSMFGNRKENGHILEDIAVIALGVSTIFAVLNAVLIVIFSIINICI